MLVEDTDAVGHASDLGPLIGHKRYENGFEPSMHAILTQTRRGRKSAGQACKARQAAVRPISSIPKLPSPPLVILIPEPKPKPVPAAVPPPPWDPTPPLPPPVTTPVKHAIVKLSIASSPLSELSNGDLCEAKHKRRIESPTPEEDTGARPSLAGDSPTKSVEVEPGAEPDGAGIATGAHALVPAPSPGNEEDTRKSVVLQDKVAIKAESEDPWQGAGVNKPHADEATTVIEAADADIEADSPDAFALHVDITNNPESDHLEAPKKDLLPASTDEAGTPTPEPPASTDVDLFRQIQASPILRLKIFNTQAEDYRSSLSTFTNTGTGSGSGGGGGGGGGRYTGSGSDLGSTISSRGTGVKLGFDALFSPSFPAAHTGSPFRPASPASGASGSYASGTHKNDEASETYRSGGSRSETPRSETARSETYWSETNHSDMYRSETNRSDTNRSGTSELTHSTPSRALLVMHLHPPNSPGRPLAASSPMHTLDAHFWSLGRARAFNNHTRLVGPPTAQRFMELGKIDLNRAFFNKYKEKRTLLQLLVQFNHIWVIHISFFWYHTAYNSPRIYWQRHSTDSDRL
ncbi:1,3-beta-D-glucan synthase [Ceratobasidium sp. 370]|nr:1,3-beta-D-glucan synthase [Ceratobasidium sp. 370]